MDGRRGHPPQATMREHLESSQTSIHLRRVLHVAIIRSILRSLSERPLIMKRDRESLWDFKAKARHPQKSRIAQAPARLICRLNLVRSLLRVEVAVPAKLTMVLRLPLRRANDLTRRVIQDLPINDPEGRERRTRREKAAVNRLLTKDVIVPVLSIDVRTMSSMVGWIHQRRNQSTIHLVQESILRRGCSSLLYITRTRTRLR